MRDDDFETFSQNNVSISTIRTTTIKGDPIEVETEDQKVNFVNGKSLERSFCFEDFTTEPSIIAHTRPYSTAPKTYECYICKYTTNNLDVTHLREHMRTHDFDKDGKLCTKTYQCYLCKYTSARLPMNALILHMRTHTGMKGQLDNHSKRKHSEDKPSPQPSIELKPRKCSVRLERMSDNQIQEIGNMLKVLKTGQSRVQEIHAKRSCGQKKHTTCSVCMRTYTSRSGYFYHIRSHLLIPPTMYECYICKYKGKRLSPTIILEHMRNRHSDVKAFDCIYCPFQARVKFSMENHMRIHRGEFPVRCTICQRGFRCQATLNEHMRTFAHEEADRHKCNICGKTYLNKRNLTLHLRMHVGEKLHYCKLCPARFASKGHLKSHHSSHTGERPYACNICSKTYSQRGHLNYHMRVHGEKKFKCSHCAKEFFYENDLKMHKERMHTGNGFYSKLFGFYLTTTLSNHSIVN